MTKRVEASRSQATYSDRKQQPVVTILSDGFDAISDSLKTIGYDEKIDQAFREAIERARRRR